MPNGDRHQWAPDGAETLCFGMCVGINSTISIDFSQLASRCQRVRFGRRPSKQRPENRAYDRAIDAGSTVASRVIVTLAFSVAFATPR
jgi:hypothetical protein